MDDAAFESDEYTAFRIPSCQPTASSYTEDGVEKYEQDVDKAKSMLEEAGVSGLKLKLGYISSDAAQSAQALLIQEQLQEVGVTVELAGGDGTAIANAMKDPDNEYDMYLGGYIMGIDPDTFSSLFENDGAFTTTCTTVDTIPSISCLRKVVLNWMSLQERKPMQNCRQLFRIQVLFIRSFPTIRFWVVNNRIQGVEDGTCSGIYLRGYSPV